MSVATSLAAVVFAIYLLGALRATPRSSWLFTSLPGGNVVAQSRGLALGPRLLVRIGTLLPGGLEASGQPWPLSLLRDGISSAPAHGMAPDDRDPTAEWTHRYEELGELRVDGRVVVLGPGSRLAAATGEEATWWCETLQRLASTSPTQRQRAVESSLRSWLDVTTLGDRLQLLRASTRRLRAAGTSLSLFVFVAVPMLAFSRLLVSAWAHLATYALLLLWLEVEFVLSHRRLFPTRRWERIGRALLHVLSPADAMASAPKLSSSFLSPFHPVALALVLCRDGQRQRVLSSCLRALRYPRSCASAPALVAARALIEECLVRAAIETEELLAPAAQEPGCLSYCPHCGEQFVLQDVTCPECRTVALLPFEAAGASK